MKSKRMSVSKFLAVASVLGLLVGCSGGGSYDNGENWGSFKCTAVSQGGGSSIGWAADQSRARDIAIDKCRAHSANPGSCQVSQCVNQ
jgi:hypothetical protein